MKILGIDPGTNILGYAIIETENRQTQLVDSGILDLRRESKVFERLNLIFNFIDQLLDKFNIQEAAIESPFYGKNVQSMLKLGRAQGVAIAAIMHRDIPVFEYAPRKIKIAITGNGNASKEQVARMLSTILNVDLSDKKFDETDAIAIALCHFYNRKTQESPSYSSWKDYAKRKGLI